MKKRRVSVEELKKMKHAVFIWCNETFGDIVWAWSLAEFVVTASTVEDIDPRHIIRASSFEEIMLKAHVLFPHKSVFTIDDDGLNMKFLAPDTYPDMLSEDSGCVVHEVTA